MSTEMSTEDVGSPPVVGVAVGVVLGMGLVLGITVCIVIIIARRWSWKFQQGARGVSFRNEVYEMAGESKFVLSQIEFTGADPTGVD